MPTFRLPLSQQIESRSASLAKDSKSSNCIFETRGQDSRDTVKRPGLLEVAVTPAIPAGTSQGTYEWASNLYVVTNNILYKITPGLARTTAGTMTGTTSKVFFAESADHTYLFMQNGSHGYVLDSVGVFTQVLNTSVYEVTILTGGSGYVSPTVVFSAPPAGVTATGTVLSVGGVITGVTITNAGSGYVAAPTVTLSGAPGTGATATATLNGFPDIADGIASGAVYLDGYTVIATKTGQIYNSDLNSPLLWNPLNYTTAEADPDQIVGIIKHFNYICVFGQWGTEFFYNAATAVGSPFLRQDSAKNEIGCPNGNSIVQFQQGVAFIGYSKIKGKQAFVLDGLSPVPISTRYIEKYLNANTDNTFSSFTFRTEGHTYYGVTLTTLALTFVYDIDEKSWYNWTSYSSSAEGIYRLHTATLFNSSSYGQDVSNGVVYSVDVNTYTDNGAAIYFRVVSNNIDSGSMRRKFFNSGQIVGDKVVATMYISHTDDDFATYSTARTVNLNKTRCIIYQCGTSRRRAWQFLVTDNVPLRLFSFELNIEGGEMDGDPQLGTPAGQ